MYIYVYLRAPSFDKRTCISRCWQESNAIVYRFCCSGFGVDSYFWKRKGRAHVDSQLSNSYRGSLFNGTALQIRSRKTVIQSFNSHSNLVSFLGSPPPQVKLLQQNWRCQNHIPAVFPEILCPSPRTQTSSLDSPLQTTNNITIFVHSIFPHFEQYLKVR